MISFTSVLWPVVCQLAFGPWCQWLIKDLYGTVKSEKKIHWTGVNAFKNSITHFFVSSILKENVCVILLNIYTSYC